MTQVSTPTIRVELSHNNNTQDKFGHPLPYRRWPYRCIFDLRENICFIMEHYISITTKAMERLDEFASRLEREEYKKAQTRLSGAYGVPDTILQLKPCVF